VGTEVSRFNVHLNCDVCNGHIASAPLGVTAFDFFNRLSNEHRCPVMEFGSFSPPILSPAPSGQLSPEELAQLLKNDEEAAK
jgi:hypothetical protein